MSLFISSKIGGGAAGHFPRRGFLKGSGGAFTGACLGGALAGACSAADPRASGDEPKRVLIVTGIDHPAHKWKLTTPVLKNGDCRRQAAERQFIIPIWARILPPL